MADHDLISGVIKNKIQIATALIGVFIPLWGGIVFAWNYEKSLVKKADLAVMDLDARIERTEIIVAIYSRDVDNLTEIDKNDYSRAKARLIQLEAQRDKLLGIHHE